MDEANPTNSNPTNNLQRRVGTRCFSAPLLVLSGAADPALTRRLTDALHSLYVLAAALAILLVLSLLVAIWAFRRNRETEPKA